MSATENKKALKAAFEALSRGDGRPFADLWAEDFCWTIIGTTSWSGTYRGRDSVRHDLVARLFAKFATPYTATASRFVAEGDYVVVEYRGDATTTAGEAYKNTYCCVCRMTDGKVTELTEYSDTDLITRVLGERA